MRPGLAVADLAKSNSVDTIADSSSDAMHFDRSGRAGRFQQRAAQHIGIHRLPVSHLRAE